MVKYTNQQIANYLRFGFWDWEAGTPDLSFGKTNLTVNLTGIGGAAQSLARTVLTQYEQATGLTFTEVSGFADIIFEEPRGTVAQTGFGPVIVNPDGSHTITSATVQIGSGWLQTYGTSLDGYSYQTFVHEIGHALGLGHAGPYNGGAVYGTDNAYDNDSWQATVMSYFDQVQNTSVAASFAYVVTPQVADLIALQAMYGAGDGRAGDTTYGYNASPGVGLYNADAYSGNISYTIWDAGGKDTLDYSGSATNDRIDLRAAERNSAELYASNVWGEVGNVMIAAGVVIENAIGGAGDNVIIGNAAGNRLAGGDGKDQIFGAGGNDRLHGGSGNDLVAGGGGADRVNGEGGDDRVYGGSGNDVLAGSSGNNRLYGEDGQDFLYGGSGNDVLAGGSGSDRLDGGAGGDQLIGGAGADVLSGNHGVDRAVYSDSTGVRADLERPDLNTGYAAGDTYGSIEGLVGSRFEDVLRGDEGANEIVGASGKDLLVGRGGSDFVAGGAGGDRMYGDSGNDRLYGGGGGDRLYGSGGNDRLYGDGDNDRVSGGSGDDFVAGGSGDDRLDGGSGADILFGGSGNDRFVFRDGDGRDTIADFLPGADTLALKRDLWIGSLSPLRVIDEFASLDGGDLQLDFGAGDTVTLLDVRTLDLEDDILIV